MPITLTDKSGSIFGKDVMIKMLVYNYIGGQDGYTDNTGDDLVDWEQADGMIDCSNCGRRVGKGGVINMDGDEGYCSGCILIQTVPQIITAYEQCRAKVEEFASATCYMAEIEKIILSWRREKEE